MTAVPARADRAATGPTGAEELFRVRGALARGASLDVALGSGAAPTTGAGGLARLTRHVRADVAGAGPVLQPLLQLDGVTDVLVGAGRTWIDRGRGLEPVPDAGLEEAEARALAVRMAAACGRRLDDASPIVDVTLPDGTRLNAVLPPLSADGTLICLRTKRRRAFTIAELVAAGTISPGLDAVLTALVECRANCLVTGATGTGKTTLLAALLGLVPADERIVCIEEASELRPDHPHVIHLQERGDNVQGVGAVPMTTLVRTALRMRPDRIVLGECRGPEVRDVLTALNTGHEGGWATLHANSPADVPARLTALGALAGLNEGAVAAQAVSALDAVVHLRRLPRPGTTTLRRVTAIGVLERDGARMRCRDALVVDADGAVHPGPGADRLAERVGDGPMAAALGLDPGETRPEAAREGGDLRRTGAPRRHNGAHRSRT
ncbi:TadA family conjugal transfer-associated ATPase [Actinomyces procaprae]|uniref:TadA family conjugal transfer-associated ATPase n=1 Tax=Actinomyces procaprae TaxID=2560010 RepID=UPI0010A22B0A|nr:TadA family conjugal transfer-associated ATPase [Actinomyces procaprae]